MNKTITKEDIDNVFAHVIEERANGIYQSYLDIVSSLKTEDANNPACREEIVLHLAFSHSAELMKQVLYALLTD